MLGHFPHRPHNMILHRLSRTIRIAIANGIEDGLVLRGGRNRYICKPHWIAIPQIPRERQCKNLSVSKHLDGNRVSRGLHYRGVEVHIQPAETASVFQRLKPFL